MRNIMIFAAVMIVLGTAMAQMADRMTPAPAPANVASRKVAPVDTVGQSGLRSLSIPRDSRGHFLTEGRIDGQRIGFVIGSGASVVALDETCAGRGRPPPPR